MAEIGIITAGGKPIHLHAFSGIVVDQQKSTYTQVNRSNNDQQQVSTTHYNKVFIQAEDGAERSIEIEDKGFSARAGNRASMIWGIPGHKDEGPYLAVINHDTGALHTLRKPINDLAGPPFYNLLLIVTAIFIAIGVFDLFSGHIGSAIALLALGGGGIYWIFSRQKALIAKVTAAARALQP
ncbi:hypothetical protein [Thiomonas intermedia]|uniref:hypothetical protein n=1 Tax=Thiomonas intermedia TaxID=926 RepID=UPI0009A547E7|nr:hypothetical protein [Thiomonas intermedia]